MSYSEYLGKYMEQQKEDETILEKCMTIVWTLKKRAIWIYGSKKMRSPVTIQINICQTQYIQHINGMGRWLALDLILITRRYTEDDPLDSEDGCVLVCMEKYTVTPPPCLSRELVYTVGNI